MIRCVFIQQCSNILLWANDQRQQQLFLLKDNSAAIKINAFAVWMCFNLVWYIVWLYLPFSNDNVDKMKLYNTQSHRNTSFKYKAMEQLTSLFKRPNYFFQQFICQVFSIDLIKNMKLRIPNIKCLIQFSAQNWISNLKNVKMKKKLLDTSRKNCKRILLIYSNQHLLKKIKDLI